MSEKEQGLLGLPRGLRDRTLVTAKLGARLGAAALKKQLGWGDSEEDEREAEARAIELVGQLGKLKGIAMKIGQMASYLPGSMPPGAQRVLSQLQDSTEPMAYSVIERLISEELGAPPEKLFEEFEKRPFAAASIGQVHAARVGGRAVAVKIQYPEIEEILRGDLRMAGAMVKLMSTGTVVDGSSLANELTTRLLEECDYRREARNANVFRKIIGQHPERSIPEIFETHSSRRVMTSARVEGMSFFQFAASASQEEKDRAGVHLFEACFQTLFEHAIFNADPHPGNYLFAPGGRVIFLDFGCARSFGFDMIETWKRFALATVSGDRKGFREGFIAMGFARKDDKRFDWDAQWQATRFLYKPFLEPNFRFEPSYISESYDILMFRNPNKMRLAMPPEWLFLNRLQWGLFAVLNELRALGPWGDLWRSYLQRPTDPWVL